jgi:hypothetical protein
MMAQLTLLCGTTAGADKDGFVDTFDVKADRLSATGRNAYFVLEPDYQLVYEATEGGGKDARMVVTVLPRTETVDGVETRVVEAVESAGEVPRRVTRQFLAIDKTTGDVYCFGKSVDRYDGWRDAGHAGGWRSGENGSRYGLLMPGAPQVGQKFYQALAAKVANDRLEVLSLTETVRVPAKRFESCLKAAETTPRSPKRKNEKVYAPGVGLLIDGRFKLVRYGTKVEQHPDAARLVAAAKEKARAAGELTEPVIPHDMARAALNGVGSDPEAERVWVQAINDPALSSGQRSDLIEDLNDAGFEEYANPQPHELPIVLNRLALIEELAPDAMDQVNADAFAEAYKDLVNIAKKLRQ